MSGPIALHGGGEYVRGDEAAMDALLAAGRAAAHAASIGGAATPDPVVRVVLMPTAAARHRPEIAAGHGERAFRAAAARAGDSVEVRVALVVDRASAADPRVIDQIDGAHVIHLPGGDPDLLPTVLAGSPAWDAALRAHLAGACVAGASAGAMALAGRLWTPVGAMDGLGLVPGLAVLPHFDPDRLERWRRVLGAQDRSTWLGLDEQTLVIGEPGGAWRVAGRGRAHVVPADGGVARSAGHGDVLAIA